MLWTVFNLGVIGIAISRSAFLMPVPTRLFTDRTGTFIGNLPAPDGTYGYWQPSSGLPPRLKACLLAVEDKRFYRHPGVDSRALLRAFFRNIAGGYTQGGSTLAMQVARLQNPASRIPINKLIEGYTALFLTARYGRENILRQYYVLVPQGNGIFGFGYSARRYFQKPVADLGWAECALLVGLAKAPGTYNLFRSNGFLRAQARARTVLRLALEQGALDGETYRSSLDHLSAMEPLVKEERPEHSYHYILRLAEVLPALTAGDASITDSVRTSLDLPIQDYLRRVADYAMTNYRKYGAANVSIVAADRRTGEILGYIGSQNYFDTVNKGSINYANVERSSGSTIKPFIYAYGLMSGNFTPASVLADLPFNVVNPYGEYSAGNFDGDYLGPMLYRHALGNSRNIPVLRILESIGGEKTYSFLKTLGLVHGDKPAWYYGYNIALGGLYVTLEDLIRSYGTLANDGRVFSLRWTRSDTADAGLSPDTGSTYVISESAARNISMFLSDPLARLPSFQLMSTMDFPFPVAFKTGTSQGMRDAWTIAYSSEYIVGIWLGHPDNEPMSHVAGSTVAGLVQGVFAFLEPEQVRGIDETPFPPPRNSIPIRICRFSGACATERCAEVSVEYFAPGSEPHAVCSIHRRFAIDTASGFPPESDCPPGRITYINRAVFPPQYAVWAVKQGYEPPPASPAMPSELSIKIVSPRPGSRVIMDPELPGKYQSLPLRAEVEPSIPGIVWYVDGEEFAMVPYPYETRWQLAEGEHVFQARFPHARIFSEKIQVTVSRY